MTDNRILIWIRSHKSSRTVKTTYSTKRFHRPLISQEVNCLNPSPLPLFNRHPIPIHHHCFLIYKWFELFLDEARVKSWVSTGEVQLPENCLRKASPVLKWYGISDNSVKWFSWRGACQFGGIGDSGVYSLNNSLFFIEDLLPFV